MSEFKIRPAHSSDASQIGDVGFAAWLRGIGEHVSSEAHTRICSETFASFARNNSSQIFVAEHAGCIVGFAATEDGDNCISDLWVSPNFEGRGAGSSLIAAMENVIAKRGYDTAEVEVLTANSRAHRLYRHLGYQTVWQGFRDDEVLMIQLHKTILAKEL